MTPKSHRILPAWLALSILLPVWLLTDPRAVSAMPPIREMVLPNHLTLVVVEEHSLPFVTFELLTDAGSWRDPAGREGLANLTAKSMLLGTTKRTEKVINQELDSIGSSLAASCGRDFSTLTLRVLKKSMDRGFGMFIESLSKPAFPGPEVHREVEKILGAIQAAEDQPAVVAEKAFRGALFGSGPYAHPVEGTKESLAKISRQAVVDFHRAFYRPNISILAVVGDTTMEEIMARYLPGLGSWPEADIPETPFESSFVEEPEVVTINRPVTQATAVIGQRGVERSNKDYYALTVMNHILGGGGLGSRLMNEIRIKRGLAYAVSSFFAPYKHPGSFQITLQTKSSTAQEAISLALDQVEAIRKEPVSDEELETAKSYLIGSFPLRFDNQKSMASFVAQIEYYGLGIDYPQRYPSFIRAVTKDDVLRVAKKYLVTPKNFIQVIVADLKEADMEGG